MAGVHLGTAPAGPGDTPARLADIAIATLAPDSVLVDRRPATVDGHPAERTLVVSHGAGGAVAVVVEQWRLVAFDHAITVTATADLAGWAALAEPFRGAVAAAAIRVPES